MPKETSYLSDYRASADGLSFDIFKPALRNILENAETPMTLGVFGTWGSGKTTLLNMLKDELDAKQLPSLKTVWFTAWKYEQQTALWRAFMLRVVDGLYPRKDDQTRYTPNELMTRAQKEGALHLERLERSLYESVSWQDEGRWSLDVGELVKQGSKLPIWLAFHLAGLGEAAKDLGLNPQMAELLEREVREHHLNQLSSMEQFAAEFEKAVRLILGPEGRLLVFVDDLDRCLPEKAVEVLEAIKLFLDVPGTVFVLGMDREVIRHGIEAHYGAMLKTDGNEEIPINGDVYLQKLIQIPFNLPPLDIRGRDDFIKMLEASLPANFQLDEVTRQVFARGLYPNPRQVKRALNVFYLLKQVAAEQEARHLIPPMVLAWPLLAKTVLIQSQWPELYKLWRQYPTLIQTLEDEYTRLPVSEDELLRGQGLPAEAEEKAGIVKASRPSATERPQATGLLAPFINERQKYAFLAEMLRYPEDPGAGRRRARFSGLTRPEVQIYVGLVGATQAAGAEAPVAPLSADWLHELESGDPVRMREVLAAVTETESQVDGTRHRAVRHHLVLIAQNPDLPPPGRAAAGDLADELGYGPKDISSFIPITNSSHPKKWFARYPVTNAQYARFLKPENFENRAFWVGFPRFDELGQPVKETWEQAGWDWLQSALKDKDQTVENGVRLPDYWRDARFGLSRSNAPVVTVSWYEANAYCKWLLEHWSELEEGQQGLPKPREIRLPTETEWILAASGEQDKRFAFGDLKDTKNLPRYANTSESGLQRTTPVWMYPAGATKEGLMDLSGNVWEWQVNYQSKDHDVLVLRGGSWLNYEDYARISGRFSGSPHGRSGDVGFRVTCDFEVA
jgi:formylglycine-generating enzyme required for sulfatase activity